MSFGSGPVHRHHGTLARAAAPASGSASMVVMAVMVVVVAVVLLAVVVVLAVLAVVVVVVVVVVLWSTMSGPNLNLIISCPRLRLDNFGSSRLRPHQTRFCHGGAGAAGTVEGSH